MNKLGKIIAVHSYKGGTGKTLISLNLAATFVKQGKNVCLMDLDFRAPSLSTLLKIEKGQYWLNDYLDGVCEIDKVLIDMSEQFETEGKLVVGLANPATEAIRNISAKDRKWEMRALGRLLILKNSLVKDRGFDYLIFDTSPGLQYSSVNAIVSADLVLVATTFDKSDVDGTKRMLKELYDIFEKKTELVLNKVLYNLSSKVEAAKLQSKIKDMYPIPMLGIIPCYCAVLKEEGNIIFTQEKPEHPFSKTLEKIANRIDNME